MGVYIKGMEMPKERPQLLWIYPDGKVITVKSDVDPEDNFNAVPVPPHGRLIDADALMKLEVIPSDNWVFRAIEKAPTIIPAEEVET